MYRYFEEKIGELFEKSIRTNDHLENGVYQRVYTLEILEAAHEKVAFRVTSIDLAVAGYPQGESNKNFGVITVETTEKTITDIYKEVLKTADPEFDKRYDIGKLFFH